jgi:hypothetical protein
MDNDLVVNNTVVIEPSSTTPGMYAVGIGIQDARNAYVHNNAIAMGGQIGDAMIAALVLYQGDNPEATTAVDFNRNVYERGSQDVDIVRFIEKEGNQILSYGEDGEYNTLQQWRAWTGADKDSYEYMFTEDIDYVTDAQGVREMVIARDENGNLPEGSKLNNTGTRLGDLFEGRNVERDEEGVLRGEAGSAYDVGALEFRGRSYVFELEALQVQTPSVYQSTTGQFSDAQYIMTDGPIDITALIRNNGSLAGSGLDIKMEIFREDPVSGDMTVAVMEETEVLNIRSNTNELVSFGTADGQGTDFMPMSYYDLNETNAPGDEDYDVPALYREMMYNVSPLYRVVISTESDELNNNNVTEATYRFYIKRASMDMVVSGNSLRSDITSGLNNMDAGEVATGLNLNVLQEGLRSLGYVIDTTGARNAENFHYDRFDRGAWEERAIDYTLWNNMFWTDGHAVSNDPAGELERFQAIALERFMEGVGENDYKHNLVVASQDFAWNNPELASMYLGASSSTVAMKQNGDMTWELIGDAIASGRMTEVGYALDTNGDPIILDQNGNLKEPWMGVMAPMPAYLNISSPAEGVSERGFAYTNATNGGNDVFATAVRSIESNQVYLGADWRHMHDISLVMKGITDFFAANGSEIIPVELTGFEARPSASGVSLTWETASEANSSHFDVERANGSGEFMKIGRVAAAGNSTTESRYGFEDAGVKTGVTYAYRLRMTDRDGQTELSDVRYVTLEGGSEMGLVTPNPVTSTATVQLPAFEGSATAMVVNSAGATVLTVELEGGQTVLEIDGSGLAGGAYNLVVSTGSGNHIRPFTVR